MSGPVWILDGRSYTTVRGLGRAIMKKHNANGYSGVASDRTLRVFRGRDDVVATYRVDAPIVGKPMRLELLA